MSDFPEIICYGCGRGEYPENTLLAIEHCQKVNKNWGIDIDLQLTKDHEIVLFHDDNTLRRTGKDYRISKLNLNEVNRLNAGYYFTQNGQYPYRKHILKIPTLKEVFSIFRNANFVLDIHTENVTIIELLIELIEKSKLSGYILIVSKYDNIITNFKKKRPHWNYGAGTKEVKKMVFSSFVFLDFLFPLKSDVLLIPMKFKKIPLLTKNVIRHIKKRGKKLIVWQYEGIRNEDVVCVEHKKTYLSLKQRGVDAIYTEYPKRFSKLLAQNNK